MLKRHKYTVGKSSMRTFVLIIKFRPLLFFLLVNQTLNYYFYTLAESTNFSGFQFQAMAANLSDIFTKTTKCMTTKEILLSFKSQLG